MPLDRSMMQLVLGLANLQQDKRRQALDESKFGESQRQFTEMAKQWAHEHEDKDFGEALTIMAKLTPEQQKAYHKLFSSRTVQQNPEMLQALEQFGVASPFARGTAAMDPNQRGMVEREGAMRLMTGQGEGGLNMSQLQGTLANDALATRSLPMGGGQPTEAWQKLASNFLANTAQGYTPEQFGMQGRQMRVAERGADVAESNTAANWEQIALQRKKLIHDMSLEDMMGKAGAKGQGLTMMQMGDIRIAMGNLLNAMKDPKSSKEDNLAREMLYNELAAIAGSDAVIPSGKIGDPNGAFVRFLRSQGVLNAPRSSGSMTPQGFGPDTLGRIIRK